MALQEDEGEGGGGGGCYICTLNDRQDQILLCERCNGEYHIYCLRPPLLAVPEYDWYCDNCTEFDPLKKYKARNDATNGGGTFKSGDCDGHYHSDELERQVRALPPSITNRYGEIIFAQGGTGYGWWPCQIYNPCHAVDPSVRQMAQKHLTTKHLVYFFNCSSQDHPATASNAVSKTTTTTTTGAFTTTSHNNSSNSTTTNTNHSKNGSSDNSTNNSSIAAATSIATHTGTENPFSILPPNKIKTFVQGLCEDLFFGLAAKNHGKQRYRSFCDAFQLACIEFDKSLSMNHSNHHQYQPESLSIKQVRRFVLDTYVYSNRNCSISSSYKADYPVILPPSSNRSDKSPRKEVYLLPSPTRTKACGKESLFANRGSIDICTTTTTKPTKTKNHKLQNSEARDDDPSSERTLNHESEVINDEAKIQWFRLPNPSRFRHRRRIISFDTNDNSNDSVDIDDNNYVPHPALAAFDYPNHTTSVPTNIKPSAEISSHRSKSSDKISTTAINVAKVSSPIEQIVQPTMESKNLLNGKAFKKRGRPKKYIVNDPIKEHQDDTTIQHEAQSLVLNSIKKVKLTPLTPKLSTTKDLPIKKRGRPRKVTTNSEVIFQHKRERPIEIVGESLLVTSKHLCSPTITSELDLFDTIGNATSTNYQPSARSYESGSNGYVIKTVRKRGRPRKDLSKSSSIEPHVKRGRGRPRTSSYELTVNSEQKASALSTTSFLVNENSERPIA